ncbi:MAG TPA: putative porin [Myxococcales bacterium]|nr:putative porin [Myxococcales bacterium]
MRFVLPLLLAAAPLLAAEPEPDTTKHVTYVPESVKAEIREQLKQEVLEQAKREGWAAPNTVPSWLSRLKPFGDVRVRFERDLFAKGNAASGDFPDFNAINTNKPFDVNFVDPSNERYLNVDQDRTRPRLRAHAGMEAQLGNGFSAMVRVGTGESPNPGSANQTVGGDFARYGVWLDGAVLRYTAFDGGLVARLGKFEIPFFNTEMLWAPDVNFDGLAVTVQRGIAFGTAGAFSLYNTPFGFPPEQPEKFASRSRWLYAAQAGVEAAGLKVAIGFFDFDKVEGRVGAACDTNLGFVSCDGDDSRPPFAQKGNTYIALRTPSDAALALEAAGTVPRYQFFGLASRFRELTLTGRYGYALLPRLQAGLEGELVWNAGFKPSQFQDAPALNNRGAIPDGGVIGPYKGGNHGILGRWFIGTAALAKPGDWLVRVQYRWVQSDAVLDALNDQDFGLGGTNLKGYGIDASAALGGGITFAARWLSANQIVGPKYGADVLQIDLAARY